MKKVFVYHVSGYLNGDFVDFGYHSSFKKAYILVFSAYSSGSFKKFIKDTGVCSFSGTLGNGDDLVLSINKFPVF